MHMTTYQQLKSLQARPDVTLVNVLPPEAFRQAHIPGSFNIPHEDERFVERVERILGCKTSVVVVYCGSYACEASMAAAAKLERAGFRHVMSYIGGTKEWQEKNAVPMAA